MKRSGGNIVLGAALLVALAGCAYQDPLALPDLDPPTASGPVPFGSYSPYYSHGYNYGYGSGYRPGYDPYYNYYYGGADPRYYRPGVVYVPYPRYVPVPCADANDDGRCDQRPHDGDDGQPHHGSNADGPDGADRGGKHDGLPRWPGTRGADGNKGDGPRLRRDEGGYGAPGMAPRVAPPAGITQPAPRAVTPTPRPAQARPPEAQRRAAPPPPAERVPRAAPARSPATVDDGSPRRRPD